MHTNRPWLFLTSLATGLTVVGALQGIAPPTPQPPSLSWYEPGEITADKTHYLLLRGSKFRIGQFDADGNFIPYAGTTKMNGLPASLSFKGLEINGSGGGSLCYEHRSGRLIRGMISRDPRGVFVPELGSTIIDLKKDFDSKKSDRVVYNLPEFLFCVPRTATPEPPKLAGHPKGWKLVPFREAYQKQPELANPWFARAIGEIMELGHLSDEGEFIPDYGLPIFPFVKVKAPDVLMDGSQRTIYYTLPMEGYFGGKTGKGYEEVYEYRSGRIIKGRLQKTGNFVPELGSKVMDFKGYDPDENRRIYNLPGKLIKAN